MVRGTRCFIASCKYSKKLTRQLAGDCSSPVVSYHRFPSDRILRLQWFKACRRKQPKSCCFTNLRICSEHFTDDDYESDLRAELLNWKVRRSLKKGTVPSLKLTLNQNKQTEKPICLIEREKRQERKARKEIVNHLLDESLKNNNLNSNDISQVTGIVFTECKVQVLREPLNGEVKLEQIPVSFPLQRNALSKTEEVANSVKSEIELHKEIQILKQKLAATGRELDKAMNLYRSRTAFLGETIANLKKEITDLKRQKPYLTAVESEVSEVLETFLSETQIKVVMSAKKCAKWTPDEIITAKKLRKISEKAYVFLQKEMNYPLPELSVLDRYAAQIKRREANSIEPAGFHQNATKQSDFEEYEIEVCETPEETVAGISEKIHNNTVNCRNHNTLNDSV